MRRKLQKTGVNDSMPDCTASSIADRIAPASARDWNFKKAKIDESAALLTYTVDKSSKDRLYAEVKPDIVKRAATKDGSKASVVPDPDPAQIYAMSLKPGLFEKLKAELELSANGAPARFAASSTSMAKEVVDTALPIVIAKVLASIRGDASYRFAIGATGQRI